MLHGLIPIFVLAGILHGANGETPAWNQQAAANWLDTRALTWFEFERAHRGQEATRTSCVSCHTVLPFMLARPALGKHLNGSATIDFQSKFLAQRVTRVNSWANLDTPAFQLFYDANDAKKKESRGTEAILNVMILGFNDRYQGLNNPSAVTKKAFANLWKIQIANGSQKGSWDWLNFGTEPWESDGAGYHGAAMAAIATGTAPGYYSKGADAIVDAKLKLLADYLKNNLASQNLYNRIWSLWASSVVDGILSTKDREQIIADLFTKQRQDGGWSLPSLGQFSRKDGTPEEAGSDGYATGLTLHVLQVSGIPGNEPRVAKGLAWLRSNQQADGSWRASSLNKKRAPETHIGKFMADAATAFAVLALCH